MALPETGATYYHVIVQLGILRCRSCNYRVVCLFGVTLADWASYTVIQNAEYAWSHGEDLLLTSKTTLRHTDDILLLLHNYYITLYFNFYQYLIVYNLYPLVFEQERL